MTYNKSKNPYAYYGVILIHETVESGRKPKKTRQTRLSEYL